MIAEAHSELAKNYYYKGVYTGEGMIQNNYLVANTINVYQLPNFSKKDTEGVDVDESFNILFLGEKGERYHNQLITHITRRTIEVIYVLITLHVLFLVFSIYFPIFYLVYVAVRRLSIRL
jgi:hypothetical protein